MFKHGQKRAVICPWFKAPGTYNNGSSKYQFIFKLNLKLKT